MSELQNNTEMSWIQVQFISSAKEILLKSRITLKWTYCFAYYLARSTATEMFEDNQRDLEIAVEALTELIEGAIDYTKISVFKQMVIDKSVYVKTRLQVLEDATARDLAEGRWEFRSGDEIVLMKK